jgi:predicted HTH transcriptional regulator
MIDNTATAKIMSKILGNNKRTIENYLSKLKEQNIIERKGSDKIGYYEFKMQK